MAITGFKYASESDLKNYFNNFVNFSNKVQIFPSAVTGSYLHFFYDSGYVDKLFINGQELGAANSDGDTPNATGEWLYVSATNQVEYFNSGVDGTAIHDHLFEAGIDFATFIDQQLVNASLELHNLLDARFPSPLLKVPQIDIAENLGVIGTSMAHEYDPIIIKAVCYIAASNLIRSKDPMDEQADYYYDLVTNSEGTGICDKLNDGKMKLSFETDSTDSRGSVRQVDRGGSSTMALVEVAGQYVGKDYDLIRITCTTGGTYGTAQCKVESFGGSQLRGTTHTNNIVTGGMDYWGGMGGLGVRFQGLTLIADDDVWEIEVKGASRALTNTVMKTMTTFRGNRVSDLSDSRRYSKIGPATIAGGNGEGG